MIGISAEFDPTELVVYSTESFVNKLDHEGDLIRFLKNRSDKSK